MATRDEQDAFNDQFKKTRQQLDEQRQLMETQRNQLNHLQALNENTQRQISNQADYLAKGERDYEKQKMRESEEEQVSLKSRLKHNSLQQQIIDDFPLWNAKGPAIAKQTNRCRRANHGNEPVYDTKEMKHERAKILQNMTQDRFRSKHAFFRFEKADSLEAQGLY